MPNHSYGNFILCYVDGKMIAPEGHAKSFEYAIDILRLYQQHGRQGNWRMYRLVPVDYKPKGANTMPETQEEKQELILPQDAAKICHQANKALCEAQGDKTQLDWEQAPDWQKDSAIAGVMFVLNNPDAGPSANHDSWLEHKVRDGWVYGPVKDAERKTHPCMVDFEDLPPLQQAKDRIFRAIVDALRPVIAVVAAEENALDHQVE